METGSFTQVYGEAAAGKTTLGLIAAVATLRKGGSVLFINAEASSPIERLEQIAEAEFSSLSDSIRILMPKSFEEQGVLLEDADLIIQKNTYLVVIDTLTRLYRISLEDKRTNYEAHRELNRQTGMLKGLARNLDVSVLVLNQVRSVMGGEQNEIEPVARNIMDYWADITLRVSLGQKLGERIIERVDDGGHFRPCHLFLAARGFQARPAE